MGSLEQQLLPLIIGLPLLAAVVSTIVGSARWCGGIGVVVAVVQTFIVLQLLLALRESDTVWRYSLGGWGAPLGIDLVVDGFAAILLFAAAVVVLVVSIYSVSYFKTAAKQLRFWPLWWLLVAGLNVAFLAGDAFNIYIALELIGLSSVALVALAGNAPALTAALRYALVGLLGSLCYLMGIAILYRSYGTLDLVSLSNAVEAVPLTWAALALISAGLLLKTALFPLHFWLPPAHAGAPAPVSAVLSALVVKASFYVLVRFWLDVGSLAVHDQVPNLFGVLGAMAIFWGCWQALRAKRLKLLVAYSTVAQLGYLFLLFPLAFASGSSTQSAAVAAVAYFMVAHAFAKTAMFLAAGSIQLACGHDDIERLRGVAGQQPVAVFAFAIAGVSLIGLPPTAGFIAKWLLLNSAIDSGQWWYFATILGGGLLTAAYVFKVLSVAFTNPDNDSPAPTQVPHAMTFSGLTMAMAAVALGFAGQWFLGYMDINLNDLFASTERMP